MPRIVGVNIPDQEKIDLALTRIYGVGQVTAKKILEEAKIAPDRRAGKLDKEELGRLNRIVGKMKVEGELREEVARNIDRLKAIGTYRGRRHIANLPVRGQRTRTNARTKRGKRMTVGALKKEAYAKMEEANKTSKSENK